MKSKWNIRQTWSAFWLMGCLICWVDATFAQDGPTLLGAVLKINGNRKVADIGPLFYGLNVEEINHSFDGGLYAELVQNRIFRDDAAKPVHWLLIQDGGGTGGVFLDQHQSINPYMLPCLRLEIKNCDENQRVGIANDGFWGIPICPQTNYHYSFYAKALGNLDKPYRGKLVVSLESSDGYMVYAKTEISTLTAGWQPFAGDLVTKDVRATMDAHLVLTGDAPGKIWFNLISLFPPTWNNRPNGNRVDLMKKLTEMQTSFLRLPGSNYLDGVGGAMRFDWKNSLHDLTLRSGHMGTWHYRCSDGLGLLELLESCEDLKAEPILTFYAGFTLNHKTVDPGPPLQPFVEDALHEIEYLTGDAWTSWGRERIADGHPAPFPLTYVEVGSGDELDKSGTYDLRFAQFFDAIKASYPQLQVIATTPVKGRNPDAIDEHFDGSVEKIMTDWHHYDDYDRKGPKIFVNGWSTKVGSPTPNFGASLADASWLIGLERNAAVVCLESYAPLLVNVNQGASQSGTSLIGFNGLTSYGSPSYYVQKMFSIYHGDAVLESSMQGALALPYSVTANTRSHTVYIKVVNGGNAAQNLQIELRGVHIKSSGRSIVLKSDSLDNTNTITEPVKISPEVTDEKTFGNNFTYSFAPYSATVLVLTEE